MIDPFFNYFRRERQSVSQQLQGGGNSSVKEYARSERIALPPPEKLSMSLSDSIQKRHSADSFGSRKLSLQNISTLLYWTTGALDSNESDRKISRPHPSGGAKYPIELYVVAANVECLAQKNYHYNVKNHTLELVSKDIHSIRSSYIYDQKIVSGAAVLLILSFVKGKNMPKYGGFAYKLGLLEGGHIGQNIYLVSSVLGLGCRALGGGDPETINRILRLDGFNETMFYTLAIGNKDKDESGQENLSY